MSPVFTAVWLSPNLQDHWSITQKLLTAKQGIELNTNYQKQHFSQGWRGKFFRLCPPTICFSFSFLHHWGSHGDHQHNLPFKVTTIPNHQRAETDNTHLTQTITNGNISGHYSFVDITQDARPLINNLKTITSQTRDRTQHKLPDTAPSSKHGEVTTSHFIPNQNVCLFHLLIIEVVMVMISTTSPFKVTTIPKHHRGERDNTHNNTPNNQWQRCRSLQLCGCHQTDNWSVLEKLLTAKQDTELNTNCPKQHFVMDEQVTSSGFVSQQSVSYGTYWSLRSSW